MNGVLFFAISEKSEHRHKFPAWPEKAMRETV